MQHINSAPYIPATKGVAERFVQLMKHAFDTLKQGTLIQRVHNFILNYRNSSHASTETPPASLMLMRESPIFDLLNHLVVSSIGHPMSEERRCVFWANMTSVRNTWSVFLVVSMLWKCAAVAEQIRYFSHICVPSWMF